MDNTMLVLRTHKHRIRVADVTVESHGVVFHIKHKEMHDRITLNEMMEKILGQKVRGVVYGQDDEVLIRF